jgi:hypothetical protein
MNGPNPNDEDAREASATYRKNTNKGMKNTCIGVRCVTNTHIETKFFDLELRKPGRDTTVRKI